MKRLAIVSTGVAALLTGYLVMGGQEKQLHAADHAEAPAVSMAANAPLDIADFYAWMAGENPDANTHLVLAMTVHPNVGLGTPFDTTGTYTFHVRSSDGAATPATAEHTVVCSFTAGDPDQVLCTLNTTVPTVVGPGNVDTNLGDATMAVHAGRFDDPFFFNALGFLNVRDAVLAAAPSLDFDANGCPQVPGGTAATLVGLLAQGNEGAAATNTFAGQNVLGIVVSIDKTLLNDAGAKPIFSAWASTEASGSVQVDRKGRPAIATALVGTFSSASKDTYNQNDDRSTWGTFAADIAVNLAIYDSLNSTLPDPQ